MPRGHALIPREQRERRREAVANVIARQPWDQLAAAVESTGAERGPVMDMLRRYAGIVLEWNRTVSNLMSRNDETRIVERHLRESLEPARWLLDSGARNWLDFGSGAGFPALPLAMLGVGEHWTLVESRRPKALFLRRVIQDLGLRGIEVFHGRLEHLRDEHPTAGGFDGFTSRATLRLVPTLEIAQEYVSQGGTAFLWKGSRRDEELEDGASWRDRWDLTGSVDVGVDKTAVLKFSLR